ncbi:hypothetical protein K0M31_002446 [Melipona bicolor]|uniref:Uncharacterized protein n=1 Tax=Melipona bicolor TaxID=60889 RepID=A0AA40GHQ2_9HYME|nr:hypothetical protein K0M31_002446 [Melipona bicolor]
MEGIRGFPGIFLEIYEVVVSHPSYHYTIVKEEQRTERSATYSRERRKKRDGRVYVENAAFHGVSGIFMDNYDNVTLGNGNERTRGLKVSHGSISVSEVLGNFSTNCES